MEGVDRINELRDEMLVNNIMSRLDCTTIEVIKTTNTISKRWKNLWALLPHLIFSYRDDFAYFELNDTGRHDYFAFIDNTLSKCPTNLNLKKFKLDIDYNSLVDYELQSQANSWIRHAISRNVEDVDLWLLDAAEACPLSYEDDLFFNASCITRMKLSFCLFNPPNGAISWERLECLSLLRVALDENMIENILSGSPCLECLKLKDCYGYKRIDVTSKSVKKLVLSGHYYDGFHSHVWHIDRININAPYISSLIIKGKFALEELVLLNMSSLIKVDLNYSMVRRMSELNKEIFRGLLESLKHVKDVTINDYCWKVYSRLKASGYKYNGCSPLLKS